MCIDEPIKFIFPCLIRPVDDDDDIIPTKKVSKKIIHSQTNHIAVDRYSNFTPVTKNVKIISPNSSILDLDYKNYYTYSNVTKK